MSAKRVLLPFTTVASGDMSQTIVSPQTSVRYLDSAQIVLAFSGTPTGAFSIETSLDGKTWIALNLAILASGAADTHTVNLNSLPFDLVRVRYVPASGTGVLTVMIMGKTVGA